MNVKRIFYTFITVAFIWNGSTAEAKEESFPDGICIARGLTAEGIIQHLEGNAGPAVAYMRQYLPQRVPHIFSYNSITQAQESLRTEIRAFCQRFRVAQHLVERSVPIQHSQLPELRQFKSITLSWAGSEFKDKYDIYGMSISAKTAIHMLRVNPPIYGPTYPTAHVTEDGEIEWSLYIVSFERRQWTEGLFQIYYFGTKRIAYDDPLVKALVKETALKDIKELETYLDTGETSPYQKYKYFWPRTVAASMVNDGIAPVAVIDVLKNGKVVMVNGMWRHFDAAHKITVTSNKNTITSVHRVANDEKNN